MKPLFSCVLFILFNFFVSATFAQIDSTTIHNEQHTFETLLSGKRLTIGGGIQSVLSAELPSETSPTFNNTQILAGIRRARIHAEITLLENRLDFFGQLGFSPLDRANEFGKDGNESPLLDAYFTYQLNENYRFKFGQFVMPGALSRMVTYQNLQFIDRSPTTFFATIDRDRGFMFEGSQSLGNVVINQFVAISTGEGRNYFQENLGGFMFSGRLEVLPFGNFDNDGESTISDFSGQNNFKLKMGTAYSLNDNAARSGGNVGDLIIAERDVETIIFDVFAKYKGASFLGEFVIRNVTIPVVYEDASSILGIYASGYAFNLQGGYTLNKHWELTARYNQIIPEEVTRQSQEEVFTLGINRYITGTSIKAQTDVNYIRTNDANQDLIFARIGFIANF